MLPLWRHQICSLSNSPQTANQEKKSARRCFRNWAGIIYRRVQGGCSSSEEHRSFNERLSTSKVVLFITLCLSKSLWSNCYFNTKEECKHKKHRISSRCCIEHRAQYHPSILDLWGGYKSVSADTINFQDLKTNSRCINSALEGERKEIFNLSFSNRTYLLKK